MRPVDLVRRVCPAARPAYLAAFEKGDGKMTAAGLGKPNRLIDFLATFGHETDGGSITIESGNYSAARMMEVWPGRFPTLASAEPYAHNAEKLFNHVYADRMGNGPESSGDGFRYRGRGMFQTTGKAAYAEWGKKLGIDLVGDPDLILSADYALDPALFEWTAGHCNDYSDRGDFLSTQRIINIGNARSSKTPVGYPSRCAWRRRFAAALADGSVDFKAPAPAVATVQEKPRSAAAVVVGSAVVAGVGAAKAAAPVVVAATVPAWAPWALGGLAVAVVGFGLFELVTHHADVNKEVAS